MSRRMLARAVGVLVLIVAIISTVTGFTASNTVPITYAGKASQAVTEQQLAPGWCTLLPLTNTIVMAANSSSVNGTSGNDLILGVNRKGNVNYNGKAGSDCIVAGGGAGTKNTLDGGGGADDICIAPAAANNTFKNCDYTVG